MPPKIDISILVGKRDNALRSLNELFEEFELVIGAEPDLNTVKNIYTQIEPRYRAIKKQLEVIADKGLETGIDSDDKLLMENCQIGNTIKEQFLAITKGYVAYQKLKGSNQTNNEEGLKEMNSTLQKMVETLGARNSDKGHGLEKLSVPTWDGRRKTYATWKKEFKHLMQKYHQDSDEQLQRFRSALPKNWWSDQVKSCRTIDKAWAILDLEFKNERKLMDELLNEMTSYRPVKRDPKSLSQYATKISCFTQDMEDNGCSVTNASEAPFVMSQLLSKLDPDDNADFGREMMREKKEENVKNLTEWLHREASIRSRGKVAVETERRVKIDSHTSDKENDWEECPLCSTRHLLSACPVFQGSTVDQRWETVRRHNRCRKCLRSHHTNNCRKPDGTTCTQCTRRHHRSLHSEKSATDASNSQLNPAAAPFVNQKTSTNSTLEGTPLPGICPVQKIYAQREDGQVVEVIAMLDSGSNTSLLSKKAAQRLGLTGMKTHLTMNLAGGEKRTEATELVDITVISAKDSSIQKTLQVYTIQKPCSPAKTVSRRAVEAFAHLKPVSEKLHLAGGTIDLLIGVDFPDAFIDVHIKQGKEGEPIAKLNCFGWYLIGQLGKQSVAQGAELHSVDVGTVSVLEDMRKLLTQDTMGVKPTKLCTCTDDALRENKFVKTIQSTELRDGRLQVKMPWKESGPPKQSNYDIALKRMLSSEKTFSRKDCYQEILTEVERLVQDEFVKEIPPEEVNHSMPEWYLPLHAVFTPERSTKIRLVFDASAKGHAGLSLNDYLEKGPNYINNLINVFMSWRWDEIAYAGDIRKMFNQILLHPEDQIFHRFLFRRQPNQTPTVFQWQRLNFGDKPAPDIATGCINMLAKSAEKEFPVAAKELKEHTYVDDIGGSKSTSTEAQQMTVDIDTILARGKFQVKAWHSNDPETDQTDEDCTTFLGHQWNKRTDLMSYKKDRISVTDQGKFTKRACLAILAQMWDPIGLVSPVTVKFRIHLQELWSSGYSWDDILPDEDQKQWIQTAEILNHLLTLTFPRKLKPDDAVGLPEFHGFCDGGELAYGAVIFLRWLLENDSYHCIPLLAKAFVAPLKKRSVPRLELLGCLALSRIYRSCEDALQFMQIKQCSKTFWTDSTTVLSWIKTPSRKFKPFVSARVAEIQENTDVSAFRYIKSKDNPADSLTRGIDYDALQDWMKGPEFLFQPQLQDEELNEEESREDVIRELKKTNVITAEEGNPPDAHLTAENVSAVEGEVSRNPILDHLTKTCSTFRKARKVLSYVLRFANNVKEVKKTGPISVEELKRSEVLLFQWCQVEVDISKIDKKLIAKVDEDGLLRAHGRLEKIRTLPPEMRNPIILPGNHPLVLLLLRQLHEARGHCGYQSLVHEARRKFWIIGLRSLAKQLTRACVTCRKLRRKPLEQLMGQVPSLRVGVGIPVFGHTALDMFGPVHIRVSRKTLKDAQVIIFACMTSRAIHLELCTDRSTDAFLLAFRRFVSLRGHPLVCWSDCGTNFKGAQSYLNEVTKDWDLERIQNVLADNYTCQFKWEWNIPRASHMNGVVESLIKSVRQAIDATCRNRPFSEEQWRTFLAETTYLVNSRPLYPSSESIWECPPITPNDLMIGPHISPPVPEPEDRVNPRNLTRSIQQGVNEFWTAWQRYFAPNLLPRNKWFRPRDNLQIGDLVLETDATPRRKWRMALVKDVYPGKDGLIRKAKIQSPSGEYERPLHKLCLIATTQELNNAG